MSNPDYFAEFHVAGLLATTGWNIYFPRRDLGFDFIATKLAGGNELIRPVQVKGKYRLPATLARKTYGYAGVLTELHDEMVLAIPFFKPSSDTSVECIAFVPRLLIKGTMTRYRCLPATLIGGKVKMRPGYAKFFDSKGLALLGDPGWSKMDVDPTTTKSKK